MGFFSQRKMSHCMCELGVICNLRLRCIMSRNICRRWPQHPNDHRFGEPAILNLSWVGPELFSSPLGISSRAFGFKLPVSTSCSTWVWNVASYFKEEKKLYLRTKYFGKYLAQKETSRQVNGENYIMWSFIVSMRMRI